MLTPEGYRRLRIVLMGEGYAGFLISDPSKEVDVLTGLQKRDTFSGFLEASIFRMENENEKNSLINTEHSLGIVYLDLDNLKKTNDIYGHTAGDALILSASLALTYSFHGGVTENMLQAIDNFILAHREYGGFFSKCKEVEF